MRKVAVLNVVGLTPSLLGEATPRLRQWANAGKVAPLNTITPAVTSTVQSTYLTGKPPRDHGVVANGWYFRDECEVKFWRQSNGLVQSPKVWETARQRDPRFTCAKMFWWHNMYSSADVAVTVRPMYPADGRKIPDIYTQPSDIRPQLNAELGQFPLFNFWGPTASIKSSQWIADATKWVVGRVDPTLTLVYLPHLDYNLQRVGPNDPSVAQDLREIDVVAGDLIDLFESRETDVIVLSEYGITEVNRPILINRELRKRGLIAVREELGLELLDAGASAAFAVCDHQIAHVYVNNLNRMNEVRGIVEGLPGVETVLDEEGKRAHGLDHPRSGELVLISEPDAWFAYYYWLDDRRAPDFARTVDIHRKPGYDPVELFVDPAIMLPMVKIARTLLKKNLGFRYLMDVIPLDPTLVKGSHGRVTDDPNDGPLLMSRRAGLLDESVDAAAVHDLILRHVFD